MTDTDYRRPKPEEPQQLNCKVCMKEIPTSVAHTLDCSDSSFSPFSRQCSRQSPDKP